MTVRARAATAAVSTLVAVAASAVGASGGAAAATRICVGVVVDSRALGGSVSSTCARVPPGSSGSEVLAAHHRVTFDPRYGDDFVCAIDGRPAGGCSAVDGTHYWVYYHRGVHATSWSLSQEGAGTYQPRNGTTEGWVWEDGSSKAPRPPDVPYAGICPPTSPTPSPTERASTPAPTRPATATVHAASRAAPTSAVSTRRAPPTHEARRTTSAATAGVPSPPTTPTSVPVVNLAHRASGGGDASWGFGIGAALLVALGLGAWWRSRRAR